MSMIHVENAAAAFFLLAASALAPQNGQPTSVAGGRVFNLADFDQNVVQLNHEMTGEQHSCHLSLSPTGFYDVWSC
jgi:hypothetical protein